MNKLVCFLLIWNVALTVGFLINFNNQQEEALYQQICILESIPPYELIEE